MSEDYKKFSINEIKKISPYFAKNCTSFWGNNCSKLQWAMFCHGNRKSENENIKYYCYHYAGPLIHYVKAISDNEDPGEIFEAIELAEKYLSK